MKALVLKEANRFEYEDVPSPQIGAEDVLIRIKASGICGSDVHGMDGSTGRRIPPLIMGHEASGVIVDVGRNVNGWSAGDAVSFDSTIYCSECYFCRRGQVNLCEIGVCSACPARNIARMERLLNLWPCPSTYCMACPMDYRLFVRLWSNRWQSLCMLWAGPPSR